MARNICKLEGCTRVVHGHGLCQAHLTKQRRHERGLKKPSYPAWQTKEGRAAQLLKNARTRQGVNDPAAKERRVGPCECCGRHCEPLCLDHCHATGVLRGWLCRLCNASIGGLGDNAEGVARALSYLSRFEELTG